MSAPSTLPPVPDEGEVTLAPSSVHLLPGFPAMGLPPMGRAIVLMLLSVLGLGASGKALGAEEPKPPAAEALDLAAVIDLALERNAGLLASRARRQEVAGGVEEAGADAWPQLELTSSWNRARTPSLLNSPDFEDILEQFPGFEPGEEELWGVALEVEQAIYSGGKVRAAIELAELAVDVTEARIATDELELAIVCAEAFYDLLLARDAVATLEVQRQARRSSLEVVEARYEIGEATELERLRAKASVAELAPIIAVAQGDVAAAESRLRALLGLGVTRSVEIVAPDRRELPQAPEFERLWQLALVGRPELKDLELQHEALARQKTVTEAEGRPQLELRGAYGRRVRLLDDLGDDLFDDWRVTLGFSWSLFDGGRRRGQVAQIDSQREQLHWRLEDQRRTVRSELQRRLSDHAAARARYAAAETAATAAAEAARVAAESYAQGVALQADLLDASEGAVRQELEADRAFYEALRSAARLRRAAGLLPTAELEGGDWPASQEESRDEN